MSLIDVEALKDYGIVLIECPLFNFNKELTKDLLCQSYSMRINSYQQSYGLNVYPFGGEEMACDHYFLTKKIKNKIQVICSLKYITLERCKFFNLNFPLFNTLASEMNPSDLYKKIKSYVIEDLKEKSTAYVGGLSSNFDILTSLERKLVRDFVIYATCSFKILNKVDALFTTGTKRKDFFKFLQNFGFDILYPEAITHKEVANLQVMLQCMLDHNKEEYNRASYLGSLWDKKIYYKFEPHLIKFDQDAA
ncbi:MAG: hypothetical protein U0T83_02755 [Bacteriovoracaceae bacterium]